MYKYCPVTVYSLSNLEKGEFFLNHYEAFNDPYECMCEVHMGFPKLADRSERLMAVLNAWGFCDFDEPLVIEHYDDYADSLEGGEPIVSDYIDGARITCFSSRPNNLLMWGHYANGLRGFCLEVDEDVLVKGDEFASVYRVIYTDTPAAIDASVLAVLYDQLQYHSDAAYEVKVNADFYGVDRSAEIEGYHDWYLADLDRVKMIFQKMLATKPVGWMYEEEVRLILSTPSRGKEGIAFSYPTEAIKSIILGGKISAEDEVKVIDVVGRKYPGIPVKKATTKAGSFELEIVDVYPKR